MDDAYDVFDERTDLTVKPIRIRRHIFAGIDPGKSGAIAWTDSLGLELTVVGMPKSEREILKSLGRLAGHLYL